MRANIEKFLNKFEDVYEEVWSSGVFQHVIFDVLNTELKSEVGGWVKEKNENLIVDSSTGTGRTTKTPWLAVFDKRITKKASEGTYIVYLFNKDEKCVYLTLAQSITEATQTVKSQGISGRAKTQAIYSLLQDEKKKVIEAIGSGSFDTDASVSSGKKDFDITVIMHKRYELSVLPSDDILKDDLFELVDLYDDYYSKCYLKDDESKPKVMAEEQPIFDVETENIQREIIGQGAEDKIVIGIYDYIKVAGFTYSLEMVENFFLCLKSKPFVILAGVSGTGKSKFVEMFSEAIDAEYKMIPVRPDWSDSSDLYGHVNLNGKFIPGLLIDLLLEANSNLDTPYLVCLDEMNLARVEYYFSDFLSVIETRKMKDQRIVTQQIMDESVFGNDLAAKEKYGNVIFSENVYIIGTVNMDETTFPFSKKVLDRANTIEFSEFNLEMGLTSDKALPLKTQVVPVHNSFLRSDRLGIRGFTDEYMDIINQVVSNLGMMNGYLERIQAQVAYRVRDEIIYYLAYNEDCDLLEPEQALDYCVLQKILPRIQGSSMILKEVLINMFRICIGTRVSFGETDDNTVGLQMEKFLEEKKSDNIQLPMPKSAAKLAFMTRRYEEDGYTSYWL